MAVLIKGMEIPDSCFLCRFCRRQEYGEYVGEDTAWSCVASKKRITDGQDLIVTFKHPDCPLVEVPDEQPEREFIKLTVRDSNGRPYYSIIYLEVDKNGIGHDFEGYSSYSLDVISDYLKRYFGFMPSAQPKKRTDKRTKTHACDSVSRQPAIDAINTHFGFNIEEEYGSAVQEVINGLPSAQPEQNGWVHIDDIYRLISGHSNYHGDNILAALTCLAEGKEVLKPITVLEAQPDQRWIPCEKGLPEEETYVLISKKPSPLSGKKWCVTIAGRFIDGRSRKVEWRDIGFGRIYDDDVLAWMPLPEPWKGDTRE